INLLEYLRKLAMEPTKRVHAKVVRKWGGEVPPNVVKEGNNSPKRRHNMEFSTELLKPIAEQLAGMIKGALERKEEGYTIREVEESLRHMLLLLGRLVLGMVLSWAEEEVRRVIPCTCGGQLHYQRRRAAKVLSVFGWVRYERSYYAGCAWEREGSTR
ncbi:hypothetical protein D6833_03550, partial [Candidatus Parcubacteria bacterium]